MRVAQEMVRMFHERHGFAAPAKPELLSVEAADIRYNVMREELEEYRRACDNDDLVQVADALADLAYTVIGSAVAHGIDLQPMVDEVHRSNMTKDAAPAHEPNRPFKGPSFEKPRLSELLLIQKTGLAMVTP